jgi:RecA/RadA recombinase
MGMDVNRLIYVEAESIESVLTLTEQLLLQDNTPKIFVVDSIAAIPTQNAIAGGFSPTETVAEKARILSLGFSKLTVPIGRHGSIFIALNQLKTKIGRGPQDRIDIMMDPFTVPGGKALSYHSSLRIWLTKRQGKSHFITDEDGEKIGATIKALIKKSRFGSEGRTAEFQIYWKGGKVRIADEESWLEALKNCRTDQITLAAWSVLKYEDGTETKFRQADWLEHLKDDKFRNRVLELMNKHLIKE